MIFAPMLGRTRKESQQSDAKDAHSQVSVSLVGFRPVYVWDRLSRDLWPSPCAPDVGPPVQFWKVPSITPRTSSLNFSALDNAP